TGQAIAGMKFFTPGPGSADWLGFGDGGQTLIGWNYGTIWAWDTATGTSLYSGVNLTRLGTSSDGRFLSGMGGGVAVPNGSDAIVLARSGQVVGSIPDGGAGYLSFSPDGGTLANGNAGLTFYSNTGQ